MKIRHHAVCSLLTDHSDGIPMRLLPKILVLLLTVTLGVIGTYSYVEVRKTEAQLWEDARSRNILMLSKIIPGLAKAMWNVDQGLARTTMSSLFEQSEVSRVATFDDEGGFFLGLEAEKKGEGQVRISEIIQKSTFSNLFPQVAAGKAITPFEESPYRLIAPVINKSTHEHVLVASLWNIEEGQGTKKFLGHVIMDFSSRSVAERVASMRLRMILFALGMGVIILTLMFVALRETVVKPITELARASLEVAQGRFSKVKGSKAQDEIGILGLNFNSMVENIESNVHNLRLLVEEGRLLSACLSFPALARQVRESFAHIAGRQIVAEVFFRGRYFGHSVMQDDFFPVDASGEPGLASSFQHVKNKLEDLVHLHVKDPQTGDELALITLNAKQGSIAQGINSTLLALCNNVSNSVGNIQAMGSLREQERMQNELATARLVQQSLLPKVSETHVGFFEIAGFFKSASECGGDWWQYIPLTDEKVLVLLGDVTGHGTASALLTAVVKGYSDSLSKRENLIPGDILSELNTVVRGASDGKRYMTMFVGIIDASKGEIVFASAGHNHPFVISEQPGGKNKIKRLQQIGARLGYCENPEYKNVTKPFLKGEVLVVFSDGLTECRNECGTEFSEVRLRKLLEDLKETHATHVKSTIEAQAFDFYKGTPQEDDITFLVVRGVAENNSQSAHEPIEVRSA